MSFRPVLMDTVLATVLTGLATWAVIELGLDGIDWVALTLAVLTGAPIALRQRAPVVATGVIVAALGMYAVLGYVYDGFPGGGIGMLVGMFSVATLRPRRVAAAVFLPTLAVTLSYILTTPGAGWQHIAQSILVLLGAWALGDSTRRWALHTEHLGTRAVQAVAEERVRIARELHDVVAHHMSVVSLQTGVAAYVLDNDPQTAGKAIAAAGTASRDALAEMRRLLDVLRVDHAGDSDHDPGYQPQPDLRMLDGLAERARAAGVPVNMFVTGRPRPLPPGPDLCAYRVAQESLTNVLKHAGRASAQIVLDYGERTFTLVVRDDGGGPGAMARSSPAGHGIRGMRERAELYGGVLTARPQPGRGFCVVLRLPMDEDG